MFYLMHMNKPVLIVEIVASGLKVVEILDKNELPFGMRSQSEVNWSRRLDDWMHARFVSFVRPHRESIFQYLNVSNLSHLIRKSHLCSLTDCYWFTDDTSERWEDVNFYQNPTNSNFGENLFYGTFYQPLNDIESPDITTNGMLPKMWKYINGSWYLYKDSNGLTYTESFIEAFASAIATKMELQFVRYELIKVNDSILCRCKSFIESPTVDFVTCEQLLRDNPDYEDDIPAYFQKIGFYDAFQEMIALDYVIGNLDRHLQNYGVIVDANSHQFLRFAPLFDFGTSYPNGDTFALDYKVTDSGFSKLPKMLDKKHLSKIASLDAEFIDNLVGHMLCWPKDVQKEAIENLWNRIIAIQKLL